MIFNLILHTFIFLSETSAIAAVLYILVFSYFKIVKPMRCGLKKKVQKVPILSSLLWKIRQGFFARLPWFVIVRPCSLCFLIYATSNYHGIKSTPQANSDLFWNNLMRIFTSSALKFPLRILGALKFLSRRIRNLHTPADIFLLFA